jgi:hypothetical protein
MYVCSDWVSIVVRKKRKGEPGPAAPGCKTASHRDCDIGTKSTGGPDCLPRHRDQFGPDDCDGEWLLRSSSFRDAQFGAVEGVVGGVVTAEEAGEGDDFVDRGKIGIEKSVLF